MIYEYSAFSIHNGLMANGYWIQNTQHSEQQSEFCLKTVNTTHCLCRELLLSSPAVVAEVTTLPSGQPSRKCIPVAPAPLLEQTEALEQKSVMPTSAHGRGAGAPLPGSCLLAGADGGTRTEIGNANVHPRKRDRSETGEWGVKDKGAEALQDKGAEALQEGKLFLMYLANSTSQLCGVQDVSPSLVFLALWIKNCVKQNMCMMSLGCITCNKSSCSSEKGFLVW